MNNTTNTKILHFEDGRTFHVPDTWEDGYDAHVDGLDAEGYPCHAAGLLGDKWYMGLTMCCGASFKGLEDYVGCRGCYGHAEGNDLPVEPVAERIR